jgi:hypothetical protein
MNIDNISPVVKTRVDARIEDFKKNNKEVYYCMSEREFIEIVKSFYNEEGRKYLAEAMGW